MVSSEVGSGWHVDWSWSTWDKGCEGDWREGWDRPRVELGIGEVVVRDIHREWDL